MKYKLAFARTINGEKSKYMTECELYGITYGCDECPQFDKCNHQNQQ